MCPLLVGIFQFSIFADVKLNSETSRRAGGFTDQHIQLNIQNRVGKLDDKTTFIPHAAASEQTFV